MVDVILLLIHNGPGLVTGLVGIKTFWTMSLHDFASSVKSVVTAKSNLTEADDLFRA